MPFVKDAVVKYDTLYAWDGDPLYAWSNDTETFYTKSTTLSVGEVLYNEDGTDSGKTIATVGDGFIQYLGLLNFSTISDLSVDTVFGLSNYSRNLLAGGTTIIVMPDTISSTYFYHNAGYIVKDFVNCTFSTQESGSWTVGGKTFNCRYSVTITDVSLLKAGCKLSSV